MLTCKYTEILPFIPLKYLKNEFSTKLLCRETRENICYKYIYSIEIRKLIFCFEFFILKAEKNFK